jgi:hypothetical protein
MRQASELSTLRLSNVKGQPLVDALCVSSLPDQIGKEKIEICFGDLENSAHLPCEAVLEVSGVAWARGEAVVQVSTQRKAIQASHSIDLSEWLPSHMLRMGGAAAAMTMAGLTREQNVTFGGWSNAAVD